MIIQVLISRRKTHPSVPIIVPSPISRAAPIPVPISVVSSRVYYPHQSMIPFCQFRPSSAANLLLLLLLLLRQMVSRTHVSLCLHFPLRSSLHLLSFLYRLPCCICSNALLYRRKEGKMDVVMTGRASRSGSEIAGLVRVWQFNIIRHGLHLSWPRTRRVDKVD